MSEPSLDSSPKKLAKETQGTFGLGLALAFIFNFVVQVPVFFVLMALVPDDSQPAILSMMFIGLTQLVYMVPAILLSRRRGETETAKGLIVGASVTFLLSATCGALTFF